MQDAWPVTEFVEKVASTSQIHETAIVESPCQLGHRSHVYPYAHLMPYAIIGEDCQIGHHVTIGTGVLLGNRVCLVGHAYLIPGVILNDDVYIGAFTVFSPPKRLRHPSQALSRVSPTLVRQGASVAPHAVISAGVTLGRSCFIEPHSIVEQTIPDFAVVSGNPLRIKGWRCLCGSSLKLSKAHAQCEACGTQFKQPHEDRLDLLERSAHSDEHGDEPQQLKQY
jgi:UDP-2-acetamido-3-amino-2,3-dideoxy-glucuronate N-acetyltransferase